MSDAEQERDKSSKAQIGVSPRLRPPCDTEMTYNSLRNANDHPSVLWETSSAISSFFLSNVTPLPAPALETSSFLIHFMAKALRRLVSGSVKSYLTSNREGRFKIASSILSGWFVVAMVKIPSFCAYASS